MDETDLRMKWAGCVAVLAECAVYVPEDEREMIIEAVDDWCAFSGYTRRRVLDSVRLYPPEAPADA